MVAELSRIVENAVSISGKGSPIILVHGFGCDQTMWNQLEPLISQGHQVIKYDLTGMGDSNYARYDGQRHASLQGHAQDLIDLLDELEAGPVVAVGHSVSATIVGLAAVARPDLFRGLVMLGPNPRYVDDPPYVGGFSREDIDGLVAAVAENYQGWAGQLAGMVAGDDETARKTLDARFCRNDPRISQHFARVTFNSDNREDFAKIKTPTLVVQVSGDLISRPEVGQFVKNAIPNCNVAQIEAAGHAPHMTHPEATANAVREFVEHLE